MSDELNEISMNEENEQLTTNPPCPNGQLYTIRSGDTMFTIARRYNVSLQRLIDANPQITNPNVIRVGQVICIPVSGPGISCPGGQIYRVVSGDTMFTIAQRYGISLDALVRANPQIADPSEIFPGQEICIPAGGSPIVCPNGTLYTVKAGDTMYDIARRNNLTLAALVAANPQVTNPDRIFPGQIICIPSGVMMPVPLPTPVVPPVPPTQVVPPIPLPTPIEPPVVMPPVMPPAVRPCPPNYGQMPICPMPVYVVVPWDECPYRSQNKCKGRKRK